MKDITLRIISRQINEASEVTEDSVEFMTEGKLYKKGSITYLVYEETEMSGMAGVTTSLRIDGEGGIRMKRFGNGVMMDTVMEFAPGKRFNSLYDTPYGAFEMEVLTNRIINDLDAERANGNLFIDYDIALKGLSEGRNLLNIEVTS